MEREYIEDEGYVSEEEDSSDVENSLFEEEMGRRYGRQFFTYCCEYRLWDLPYKELRELTYAKRWLYEKKYKDFCDSLIPDRPEEREGNLKPERKYQITDEYFKKGKTKEYYVNEYELYNLNEIELGKLSRVIEDLIQGKILHDAGEL